jgi:hypothetical protein
MVGWPRRSTSSWLATTFALLISRVAPGVGIVCAILTQLNMPEDARCGIVGEIGFRYKTFFYFKSLR